MEPFTITQTISNERISNVLCSALEGGISYWASLKETLEPTAWEFTSHEEAGRFYLHDYPLNPGGALLMNDDEDDEQAELRLDREAIQKGLVILIEKYPHHIAAILAENDDADTGDALVQCALFGDIIYG